MRKCDYKVAENIFQFSSKQQQQQNRFWTFQHFWSGGAAASSAANEKKYPKQIPVNDIHWSLHDVNFKVFTSLRAGALV